MYRKLCACVSIFVSLYTFLTYVKPNVRITTNVARYRTYRTHRIHKTHRTHNQIVNILLLKLLQIFISYIYIILYHLKIIVYSIIVILSLSFSFSLSCDASTIYCAIVEQHTIFISIEGNLQYFEEKFCI